MDPVAPHADHLDVLVLARNEAQTLKDTLPVVRAALGEHDRLHVVADNCTDDTAGVAEREGAIVHLRSGLGGPAGKGAALRWWLATTRSASSSPVPVLILDADSLPAPDLMARVRERMADGDPALQVRLEPRFAEAAVPRLAAYSEIIGQRVFDRARAKLRWPVRLRGTGMAFQRAVLEGASEHLRTSVEDAELTILLASEGIPIRLELGTWVVDPKPEGREGAIRQRARWLRGQWELVRRHPVPILRLLMKGPAGWSLLASVLVRPKSLIVPLEASLASGLWVAWILSAKPVWIVLAALATVPVLVEALGLSAGLRLLGGPTRTLSALRSWPAFLGIWLRSLGTAIRSEGGWLRSRPEEVAGASEEPGREE